VSCEIKKLSPADIKGEDALKLENQLCFPLYAAARKVTGAYTPFLKPFGITYTQYIVFMVLWEKDDITVSELGKKLYLDSGTLTPLLKKMEKEGFLTRKRSAEDERRVEIKLTKKGRDLKKKAIDVPKNVGECIKGKLSEKDAKALYELLYKML
jgi:MarR family transcriptional regulator, organic hydroperoxide resistance regulator